MITAAADGSCLSNPGPAGWAWYIDPERWAAGGWPQGTNNQGELMAVLDLLRATAHVDDELLVLCDSQYVINSLTKWLPGWKRRGWRKADNKPVENRELMQQLDEALTGRRVRFEWVKGHTGHPLNEAADARARAVATALRDNTEPECGPGFPGAPPAAARSGPARQGAKPAFFEATLFDVDEGPEPRTGPQVEAAVPAPGREPEPGAHLGRSATVGGVTPSNLELLVTIGAPSLSPDGSRAVYATSRPSLATDSYLGRLWVVPTSGDEAPRPLTRGLADSAPQYSPDGSWIAFLRGGPGQPSQLAIVEAAGGEPRVLTDAPLGVSEFAWSWDSARLAFIARVPEPGRYGTLDGVTADREDPRWITGNQFQANGLGYTQDRPRGLYVVDVPEADEEPWAEPTGRAARDAVEPSRADLGGTNGLPAARLLSPQGADCAQPEFAPGGEHIYVVAALHERHDDDIRTSIYRIPIAGGDPELVAGGPDSDRAWSRPRFSRSGTLHALTLELGPDGLDFVGRPLRLACLEPGQPPQLLTGEEVDHESPSGFLVPFEEDAVMAPARVRGSGELHVLHPDGRREVLVDGPQVVTAAAEQAGCTVAVITTATRPPELVRLEGGRAFRLTDAAAPLLAEATPVAPRELTVTTPDGSAVHGWVFVPEGPGPHPVLLNIHGGPFANFDWSFFDEAQVYAGAGYAVVQCNPRGSASYGMEHGRAVKDCMGTVDMVDVLAFLDGACAEVPGLDGDRVGIMGGSYGGYLSAWTISHDHRFKAAIVERGYLDPAAFVGTSDIGWFFSDAYVGTDPAAIEAQSPYARVSHVRTPTLLIHSEQDLRCPLEQAQRYFAALRRNGVETTMLVFPGEDHELSRSGSPWHRKQRFEAILGWWRTHLPVKSEGAS